ncbi:MAG: phosphodiester glycosidase family protein [Bacteroidota bacterium]
MKYLFPFLFQFPLFLSAQWNWQRVDSVFGDLPTSVHVYRTQDPVVGKPNVAYYLEADLRDATLDFRSDTSYKRRLTPAQFHQKLNAPLAIVNTSFFSFTTHQNLNMVMDRGQMIAFNVHSLPAKGKDTLKFRHPLVATFGINGNRRADVAWTFTDSSKNFALASQVPMKLQMDSSSAFVRSLVPVPLKKWNMKTAVSGGPVLVQDGKVLVTNNEEWKFAGKAIDDRHPRTAMGYTRDGKLIILVVEGRFPGRAEGTTLTQTAEMLVSLGCVEGLNLDGGGSSCLLVNGKETIQPSDKEGQRAIPGIFYLGRRRN